MESHADRDYRNQFFNNLHKRADTMREAGLSQITGGLPGESVLATRRRAGHFENLHRRRN